jgi:hypothetical protein
MLPLATVLKQLILHDLDVVSIVIASTMPGRRMQFDHFVGESWRDEPLL